jgi:uncharacterized protein YbjT (DUF2867 family)
MADFPSAYSILSFPTNEMNQMKLVVFGASGATGMHVVRLATAADWNVFSVVRAAAARSGFGAGQWTMVGDPTDPADAAKAVRGADAVAICLGISRRTRSPFSSLTSPADLTSRATATIVAAMQREGVRRIVYISAFGAGDSWALIPWWARAFIRMSNIRYSMEDHTRSEVLLANSGLDWTSLRPPTLDDKPSEQPARPMREGDSLLSRVSRESLARTVVQVLRDASTHGRIIPLAPPET